MAAERLYTDAEVKEAMIVGIGLGGIEKAGDAHSRIEEALDVFRGGHGQVRAHYALLKGLHERHEWKALAETHLAAGHMSASEAGPHALLGLLAIGLEIAGELGQVARAVDALDTGLRAR